MDHTTREYGAFLWKDANGVVHHTELIPGTANGIPSLAGMTLAQLGMPSWSSVVGFIHNHPEIGVTQSGQVGPHGPDYSKPDDIDWKFLEQFTGPQYGANPIDMRQYIVNGDEVGNSAIHEYDLFENGGMSSDGDAWRNSVETYSYNPF